MTRTIEQELARIGCLAAEPSPETIRLERWCQIGSEVAIAFSVGFIVVAWWLS